MCKTAQLGWTNNRYIESDYSPFMQKNGMFTMACLALVIGVLAVSIGTIMMLTASTSFALAPVNHTGGKKMSGSLTGTNTTRGIMCTPHYPC
jgi:hypothetical protein